MSLLEVQNLEAAYGASQALFGVELSVEPGAVIALMGRNGMGKTTTVKAICRMLPSKGRIVFDGQDVTRLPSHRVGQLGVGLVPEGRRCFANLSVEENLIAAARPGYWNTKTVSGLFPKLNERRTQSAGSLSGGEQQMLAIGRALMTNPKLLILDEATEGLAPLVRQEIWTAIAKLKTETGLSIIVIDKALKELTQIADHGVILQRGETIWSGTFDNLTPELARQSLGV